MGGSGSGYPFWHPRRGIVETTPWLRIGDLRVHERLDRTLAPWTFTVDVRRTAFAMPETFGPWTVERGELRDGGIVTIRDSHWGAFRIAVREVRNGATFRLLFECVDCLRRVTTVYERHGHWACRRCSGLTYHSSQRNRRLRTRGPAAAALAVLDPLFALERRYELTRKRSAARRRRKAAAQRLRRARARQSTDESREE